jgi:hypothetical protein
MGLCEIGHAVELEVVLGEFFRFQCRAEARLIESPVDPARRKTTSVCGLVVVVHAFRNVKNLVFFDDRFLQRGEHIFKVTQRRLERTNVVGSEDGVEFHLQFLVARTETFIVNVGQHHQLVMFFEVLQRAG